MIVAMQESASEEQIQQVIEHLVKMGFEVHRSTGVRQTVLGAVGARVDFDIRELELLNGLEIGGNQVVVMAGPCSVESHTQLFAVAEQVAAAGARVLRGGAFKPR